MSDQVFASCPLKVVESIFFVPTPIDMSALSVQFSIFTFQECFPLLNDFVPFSERHPRSVGILIFTPSKSGAKDNSEGKLLPSNTKRGHGSTAAAAATTFGDDDELDMLLGGSLDEDY